MNLDSADLRMAFVAARFYVDRHTVERRTPNLAVFKLLHNLEQLLAVSEFGQEPVGVQQEWVTVKQAAERTGYSERRMRRHAQRIGRKFGWIWLIPADALPSEDE